MILEEMFRGNFTPLDLVTPSDPEYRAASEKVDELTDQLKEQLSPIQKKLLDDLLAQVYTAQCFESEEFFAFGFAAGVQTQREIEIHMSHYNA